MLRNALLISDHVLAPCPVGDQYALGGFSAFIQVLSKDQAINPSRSIFASPSQELSINKPETRPLNQPTDFKMDGKVDLSITNQHELDWTDDFLKMMWPAVFETGFKAEQIALAAEARRARQEFHRAQPG